MCIHAFSTLIAHWCGGNVIHMMSQLILSTFFIFQFFSLNVTFKGQDDTKAQEIQ